MAFTKGKIQFIKSELIADSIINLLEKQGYFDLWVLARDKTRKDAEGNIYQTYEKVDSSVEALDELRHLILKEINEIV